MIDWGLSVKFLKEKKTYVAGSTTCAIVEKVDLSVSHGLGIILGTMESGVFLFNAVHHQNESVSLDAQAD